MAKMVIVEMEIFALFYIKFPYEDILRSFFSTHKNRMIYRGLQQRAVFCKQVYSKYSVAVCLNCCRVVQSLQQSQGFLLLEEKEHIDNNVSNICDNEEWKAKSFSIRNELI